MSYIHNTSHIYGKLDPRANKNIFIKYFDYSMGYVMYNEHPDGGMTKIESHNVDFIENVFPNIDEVKRVLNSMSCKKKTFQSLKDGRELQSYVEITKDCRSNLPPTR